eukprot:45555_1
MTEWRQISSGCFNISQFMLLWVLDPVRNYMTHATETQKNTVKCDKCHQHMTKTNEKDPKTPVYMSKQITNFRQSNRWRVMLIGLCILNTYNILYSFVFSTQNYYNLVDSSAIAQKGKSLYYLSYGTSFAISQFNTWALFQFIDYLLNVLLNEEEREKNKQRSKISISHKYTWSPEINVKIDRRIHKKSSSLNINTPPRKRRILGSSQNNDVINENYQMIQEEEEKKGKDD